ncbi:MAG TPA: endonuclease III domain-containing protein [Methanothermococcus okinawensis]|uniref:Endonuclease III domain-containing protein n=1 Tax=Methanothermococcus okinawensis TaxID=155863 RepID=A0A833E0F2_9EURY|nr:endonuclease III domain-containing protein [Methanococcaceae archaeon]HIP84902.1 endonuclease III domain-containing protein [Methanothermococcus okinawensis]HIP91149.1 endonuclease III domain-containing protein [Methanothermococcus okinawensis]
MDLRDIYSRLLSYFGPQGWWPAETPYEVVVGAILTQNTSWRNVERAIDNLRRYNLLDEEKILDTSIEVLKDLIRVAGFYNIKSRRLKNITEYIVKNYTSTEGLKKCNKDLYNLREELLSIKGVGRETADTILLYSLERPIFVVDNYTRRILSRWGIVEENLDYDRIRTLFESNIPRDIEIYKEYHALIVQLGKTFCRKRRPRCEECPLMKICRS